MKKHSKALTDDSLHQFLIEQLRDLQQDMLDIKARLAILECREVENEREIDVLARTESSQ